MTNSKFLRLKPRTVLVAVLIAGPLLTGFAVGRANYAAEPATNAGPVGLTGHPMLPDFADLVAQVRPAVVSITAHLKVTPAGMDSPPSGQFPFPFPFQPPMAGPQAVDAEGSGFLVNPNGTIVTNNHVVKDVTSVTVTLSDGRTLPGRIIGTDPRTDLAVLRINAGYKLPYVELGDSSKVRPGQWVIAIGAPFGLSETVTAGIVSATGRAIDAGPYDSFLQVDAPINKGNSGGPLFDQEGKVIGVDTAILSPTGGSVGIGFAIPSNMVRTIVAQLERSGHVIRGYLGVVAQSISPAMEKALGLPDLPEMQAGALIASVQPDTPAAAAGLRPGDVIRSVNGKTVGDPRDLAVDIAAITPGQTAHIHFDRNGMMHTIDVRLAELPNHFASLSTPTAPERARLGLALESITPEARAELNLPENVQGALVARVQTGSPAELAGLEPGDVIVGVDTTPVDSARAAIRAIRSAEAQHPGAIALRVIHHGQSEFVAIDLGESPNQG